MDRDCDFSPLKKAIKEDIQQVIKALHTNLAALDEAAHCALGDFEKIKEQFVNIEMKAASFYLNCYLSPFTDKYAELTNCIRNLSKVRHGGLIVIQREDALGPLIKPGIFIGAELTHSLLESLFYPGNPLHDGAVIISQNQIVSAANVLPLSNEYLGELRLGTRHRAALGLSERSDALVLVVSEETGRISFAIDGNLYPLNAEKVV